MHHSYVSPCFRQTTRHTEIKSISGVEIRSEKCDFCALCRVLGMHLACTHSKQITLQNFIANKQQDLRACRFFLATAHVYPEIPWGSLLRKMTCGSSMYSSISGIACCNGFVTAFLQEERCLQETLYSVGGS